MFISWVNHADIYISLKEKRRFAVFRKNSIKCCSGSIKLLKAPRFGKVTSEPKRRTWWTQEVEWQFIAGRQKPQWQAELYPWIPEPQFIRLYSWWQNAEDWWWGHISVKTSFFPRSNPAVNLISWCRVKGHAGNTVKPKESFDKPNLQSLYGLLAFPANT